jgi:hypothetical protein
VVAEVVDALVGLQVEVVQDLVDAVSLHPEHVPVLSVKVSSLNNLPVHFSPTSLFEAVQDAVAERSFELNLRAKMVV